MINFDGSCNTLAALANEATECRTKNGFYTPRTLIAEGGEKMLGKLMLVVSEVSEMAEAVRSEDFDNFCEEAADVFIRMLDICNSIGMDVEYQILQKMKKNRERSNLHGKKCRL